MTWTHLSSTTPKARKPHCCCFCERTIEIGEVHTKWTGLYDGDFISSRAHTQCNDLRNSMTYLSDDEHPDPAEFREQLEQKRGQQ